MLWHERLCQSYSRTELRERTTRAAEAMSALPPKADMCGATRDVRFVPIADIGQIPAA
jgi:hypothetical protein